MKTKLENIVRMSLCFIFCLPFSLSVTMKLDLLLHFFFAYYYFCCCVGFLGSIVGVLEGEKGMFFFFLGFLVFLESNGFSFLLGKMGKMRDFSVVLLGYVGQEFCLKLSWKFLALFRGLSCICKNGEKGGFFG